MTVEEAARIHREKEFKGGEYSIGIKEMCKRCESDFIAGAEWQAKQSPWISVEERLPDIIDDLGESEYVLVRYKDCIPIVAKYCTEEYHFCPSFKVSGKKIVSHWWTNNSEWIKHKITHWMPIPSFGSILKDKGGVK